MVFVAAIPILAALLFLVVLRWPARLAMPVCAAVTAMISAFPWGVSGARIAAATIEGLWVTASILLIVFGALLFLDLLRRTGAIAVLQRSFGAISPDGRVQAVLVGWILGSFLEGAAGFGTPAAITAPLLIGLGFRPLSAVVVALVGDSTAVSFGAVGTPMIIGMGQGLAGAPAAPEVADIARQIATADLVLGTVMPAILVLAVVFSREGARGLSVGLAAAPFALTVGAAQAGGAWAVAHTLGPEFPSLVGPITGLAMALLLVRTGWFIPRSSWSVQAAPALDEVGGEARRPSAVRAFAPYGLLLAILIVSRAPVLPVGGWLRSVGVGMSDILGTGLTARVEPLFSPGAAFLVCAALSAPLLRAGGSGLARAAVSAAGVTGQTAIALVAAIVTVRLFIHSGENAAGLDAMPLELADALAHAAGGVWPVVAPWVGALGSFIAGSATFSNMLFARLQLAVASDLGFAPAPILALQGIGSAAGNMVCVHNVVAACAVAGILGQEGSVIRRTALPMLAYLLLAGVVGWVMVG